MYNFKYNFTSPAEMLASLYQFCADSGIVHRLVPLGLLMEIPGSRTVLRIDVVGSPGNPVDEMTLIKVSAGSLFQLSTVETTGVFNDIPLNYISPTGEKAFYQFLPRTYLATDNVRLEMFISFSEGSALFYIGESTYRGRTSVRNSWVSIFSPDGDTYFAVTKANDSVYKQWLYSNEVSRYKTDPMNAQLCSDGSPALIPTRKMSPYIKENGRAKVLSRSILRAVSPTRLLAGKTDIIRIARANTCSRYEEITIAGRKYLALGHTHNLDNGLRLLALME